MGSANASSMNGPTIAVHGVHLEEADLALGEELCGDVGGRDGVDVAGAQHQADLAGVVGRLVELGPARVERGLVHAGLEVDLGVHAHEEQRVLGAGGEHLDR
jgi:hypothetical protein